MLDRAVDLNLRVVPTLHKLNHWHSYGPPLPGIRSTTPEGISEYELTAGVPLRRSVSVIGLSVFGSKIQAKDHRLGTVHRTVYPT